MNICDTAIILAGGKSKRMGFDKQLIEINNEYLIDKIIKELIPKFKQIIIISNTPKLYNLKEIEVYSDIIKDVGPLGGVYTGLKYAKSKYSYIIACDMPNINHDYIDYIKSIVESDNVCQAVITKYKNWIEPFNAVYSKELISKIEKYFDGNERSINKFLENSDVKFIEEDIARNFSYNWDMFVNLNDVKELKKYHRKGNYYECNSKYANL